MFLFHALSRNKIDGHIGPATGIVAVDKVAGKTVGRTAVASTTNTGRRFVPAADRMARSQAVVNVEVANMAAGTCCPAENMGIVVAVAGRAIAAVDMVAVAKHQV